MDDRGECVGVPQAERVAEVQGVLDGFPAPRRSLIRKAEAPEGGGGEGLGDDDGIVEHRRHVPSNRLRIAPDGDLFEQLPSMKQPASQLVTVS